MAEIKTIDNSWSWHSLDHLDTHITHFLPVMQTCHSNFLAGSSRGLFYGHQISACINLCQNTLLSGDSSHKVIQENRPREVFLTMHNTLKWKPRGKVQLELVHFHLLGKRCKEQKISLHWREFTRTKYDFQVMWMYATEDGVLPSLILLTNGEHTQLSVFLQLSISSTSEKSQCWVRWIQGKDKWERAALALSLIVVVISILRSCISFPLLL